MKQIIAIFSLLLSLMPLSAQNKKEFYSPNGEFRCTIILLGKKLTAEIFDIKARNRKQIYNSFYRYSELLQDVAVWRSNDLLEIKIPTGSPGIYSVFYSVKRKLLSDEYFFPLAVEGNRYWILTGGEEVAVYDIFTKAKYLIKRDYLFTAIKYLVFNKANTYFRNDGNLQIEYTNSLSQIKREIIEKDEIIKSLKVSK
jgi:hypothetical protein